MTKIKVKFNRNVKFNSDPLVTGQSLEVSQEDYENLLTAGVIDKVDSVSDKQLAESVDLFALTREELGKVNKADIVRFLKVENIDFDEKAKKEDLVELIAGE